MKWRYVGYSMCQIGGSWGKENNSTRSLSSQAPGISGGPRHRIGEFQTQSSARRITERHVPEGTGQILSACHSLAGLLRRSPADHRVVALEVMDIEEVGHLKARIMVGGMATAEFRARVTAKQVPPHRAAILAGAQ